MNVPMDHLVSDAHRNITEIRKIMTLIDTFLGLLTTAASAYGGFAAAVLVYRHGTAIREATPLGAYALQALFALLTGACIGLALMLVRIWLDWLPSGAEPGFVLPYFAGFLAWLVVLVPAFVWFERFMRR